MANKTCPLTRGEFLNNASPLGVRIGRDGTWTTANPKLFDTSSVGYCLTGKVLLPASTLHDAPVMLATQVSMNITAIGSKDLPPEPDAVCNHATSMVREDISACDLPRSKEAFLADAPAVTITLGTNTVTAVRRKFSSGKIGWYYGGKLELNINGTVVKFQVGANLVGIGTEQLSEAGIPIAGCNQVAENSQAVA